MIQYTNQGHRLQGFYRGKVLKHLPNGYCKIFISGVYPSEFEDKPDSIPDAEQAATIFGGNLNGNGEYSYPHIGSTVWCFFANEDCNYPVYFAATLGGEKSVNTKEKNKPKGSWEEVRDNASDSTDNDTTGLDSQKHLFRTGNCDLKFEENGIVTINVKGKDESDKDTVSTITVDGKGLVTIKTSDSIILDTQTISMNASDNITMTSPKISINGNESILLNSKVTKVQLGDQDSTKEMSEEFNVYTKRFVADTNKTTLQGAKHAPLTLV